MHRWPWIAPHPATLLAIVLFALSAPPRDWGWIFPFFCLIPFLWLLDRRPRWRDHLVQGLWLQLGWGLVTFSWVLELRGDLWHHPQAATALVYLVIGPLSCAHLTTHALLRRGLRGRFPPWQTVVLSAAGFVLLEQAFVFADFKLAHFLHRRPELLSLAGLIGATGVSFCIVLISELALLRRRGPLLAGVLLALYLVVSIAYFHVPPSEARTVREVAVVQTDQSNSEVNRSTFVHPRRRDYAGPLKVMASLETWPGLAGVDLIVLPESLFGPYFWYPESPQGDELRRRFEAFLGRVQAPAVFGVVARDPELRVLNELLVASPGPPIVYGRHPKRRAMPLGESLPLLRHFPALRRWFFSFEVKTAAQDGPILGSWSAGAWGGLICNEIFYADLSATQRRAGARLAVVIGNEALVRGTAAHDYLLAAAVVRAVENGIPYVKAVNGGRAFHVSSRGEVLGQLPTGTADVLHARVELGPPGPTYFARHPWLVLQIATGLLIGAFLLAVRRSRTRGPTN